MANTRSGHAGTTMIDPPSSDRTSRVQVWSGRIGSLALIGLASAHTVTNARGFAGGGPADWALFAVFALGLSLVLVAIAVITWRYPHDHRGGCATRVVTWRRVIIFLAAVFCLVTLINVLRLHPEVIVNPAGPGPWVLVAAPALWIMALNPPRRRSGRLGDPRCANAARQERG